MGCVNVFAKRRFHEPPFPLSFLLMGRGGCERVSVTFLPALFSVSSCFFSSVHTHAGSASGWVVAISNNSDHCEGGFGNAWPHIVVVPPQRKCTMGQEVFHLDTFAVAVCCCSGLGWCFMGDRGVMDDSAHGEQMVRV